LLFGSKLAKSVPKQKGGTFQSMTERRPMPTRDEFLLQCVEYQQGHNRITLAFVVVFFIQIVLINSFGLWDAIRGWPVYALSGIEIIVFLTILKMHEKKRGVRCPYCHRRISYGAGPHAVRGARCPHCRNLIISS
jgi:DNA-directed RNA polymerase subunit RPC12/RpoP